MSDPIFAPTAIVGDDPIPTNAEWLYVRDVLYVLRGVYFDPVQNKDVPLPPHRWVLVNSETVFVEGTTSDDHGNSSIPRPDVSGVDPDALWSLALVPVFPSGDSSDYGQTRSAFVDVDEKEWVRSSDLGAVDDGVERIESRRLLRIPLWLSQFKAETGGFEQAPPGTAFAKTGKIKTSELGPFGTADAPWLVRVDLGWQRTYVQLRFYDPKAKKSRALPKGIMVAGVRTDGAGNYVVPYGASSVTLDDGSIYLLWEGTADTLVHPEVALRTPSLTELDLSNDRYATVSEGDLERVGRVYTLPTRWRSGGQEAWVGPGEPSDANRQPFEDLKSRGTQSSAPLCFHLDDIALLAMDGTVRVLDSTRLGVYDSWLKLRNPAKAGDGKYVPWTDLQLKDEKSVLRAEKAGFTPGAGVEGLTRLVEHEGDVFEIGLDRVTKGGHRIGARAGRTPSSTSTGTVTYFYLPTPYLRYAYGGKNPKLGHYVTYTSAFIDVTTHLTGTAHGFQGAAREAMETGLVAAASRWDQAHPGNLDTTMRSSKKYVVVPTSGLTDDSTAVLVKHVFATMTKQKDTRVIQVGPKGRAHADPPMQVFLLYGESMTPMPLGNGDRVERPFDFEARGLPMTDPFDGQQANVFTLAHELGHWCLLQDEYLEPIDLSTSTLPQGTRIPRIGGQVPRPYANDETAMMRRNCLPRLRYARPAARYVQTSSPTPDPLVVEWSAPGKPTLRYAGGADDGSYFPWSPISSGGVDFGIGQVNLFRASDDEGTRGAVLNLTGVQPKPFDGLMVLSPLVWLDYARFPRSTGEQWHLLTKLAGLTYSTTDMRSIGPRFAIETPGADAFTRVAVLLQPRFEFGPLPTVIAGVPLTQAASTVVLSPWDPARAPSRPQLREGCPAFIDVSSDAIGMWFVRLMLKKTVSTLPTPLNNAPLSTPDLVDLPAELLRLLVTAKLATAARPVGVVTQVGS